MSRLSLSESASATGDAAIRPFTINIPQEELTDLRRSIRATRWPERKRSRMNRKAYSSRRSRNSRAIGRRTTTGEGARRS